MVEIRYDLIKESPGEIRQILDSNIKQIASCRPGKYTQEERMGLLQSAIENGASYIDVEIDSTGIFLDRIINTCRNKDCNLIISYHNYEITPGIIELRNILDSCFNAGANVAKLACTVKNVKDNARLLSLYEISGRKVILGMGEQGRITRIAALQMGAEFTFVSLNDQDSTAPGQLTYADYQTLKNLVKIR
jgi:3-dehydroquinate dehydratase-1